MPEVGRVNIHHISLTVTSLDRSIPWYEKVFGLEYQMEEAHEGGVAKVLADPDWRLVIGLHQHDSNQGERFALSSSPRRPADCRRRIAGGKPRLTRPGRRVVLGL